MKILSRVILPIVLLCAFIMNESIFVLNEWERGLRLQFGKIVQMHNEAGLHFKVPFIQKILKFDQRIQTLDTKPERFLTREKKNLIVDTFIKWRITDPVLFYQRVQGSAQIYNSRLDPIIKDSFRAEFGKKDLQEVVAGYNVEKQQTVRDEIQKIILARAKEEGVILGVEVIDVRIKGVELPTDVRQSVYKRMETERETVAEAIIAEGEAAYIRIVADADRQRVVGLAKAYEEAEGIRGKGDAVAADIYAKAYTQDKTFYEFNRSLEAYRQSFKNKQDIFILDPESKFFQFFQPK